MRGRSVFSDVPCKKGHSLESDIKESCDDFELDPDLLPPKKHLSYRIMVWLLCRLDDLSLIMYPIS
jgi:hypothetical protein